MSGLIATAKPHRIKAAHRRRRKAASGQSVQRYYDPGTGGGRFISVDPVGADPNTGANFNRYAYANNNPYKFTDPDGRLIRNRHEVPGMPSQCGSRGAPYCVPERPQDRFGLQEGEEKVSAESNRGGLAKWSGAEAGDEAAQYWAGKQVETNNPLYAVPGVLSSMWTPDTAFETAFTLAGGGSGRALRAAGNYTATALLASKTFGPGGKIFGNKFYAGQQGVMNYGTVRLGWSYNAKSNKLEFSFRVGKEHFKIFERLPP